MVTGDEHYVIPPLVPFSGFGLLTETKKPAFPQTPDGVTDWEQVFEGPDGLIALVGHARSAPAIREIAIVVISQLFTRKQDQLEVARLTHQLDKLVVGAGASGDINGLSQTVISLLRQIKDERIRKAQEYLVNKKKKRSGNRRSITLSSLLSANAYRLINDPKFSLKVGGATFIVLIGALGILINIYTDGKLMTALGFGDADQPEPQIEQTEKPEDTKESEKPETLEAAPTAASPKPDLKNKPPAMPPGLTCLVHT